MKGKATPQITINPALKPPTPTKKIINGLIKPISFEHPASNTEYMKFFWNSRCSESDLIVSLILQQIQDNFERDLVIKQLSGNLSPYSIERMFQVVVKGVSLGVTRQDSERQDYDYRDETDEPLPPQIDSFMKDEIQTGRMRSTANQSQTKSVLSISSLTMTKGFVTFHGKKQTVPQKKLQDQFQESQPVPIIPAQVLAERKAQTDEAYKKFEEYFTEKFQKLYLEKVHRNQIKSAEQDVSSEEDKDGNLKPSKRPFNEKDVTFDFRGKVIKIKKPSLKQKSIVEIENRVRINDDKTKKLNDLVKPSLVTQIEPGEDMLKTYGETIQSKIEQDELAKEQEELRKQGKKFGVNRAKVNETAEFILQEKQLYQQASKTSEKMMQNNPSKASISDSAHVHPHPQVKQISHLLMQVNKNLVPQPGLALKSESEAILVSSPRLIFSRKQSLAEYREQVASVVSLNRSNQKSTFELNSAILNLKNSVEFIKPESATRIDDSIYIGGDKEMFGTPSQGVFSRRHNSTVVQPKITLKNRMGVIKGFNKKSLAILIDDLAQQDSKGDFNNHNRRYSETGQLNQHQRQPDGILKSQKRFASLTLASPSTMRAIKREELISPAHQKFLPAIQRQQRVSFNQQPAQQFKSVIRFEQGSTALLSNKIKDKELHPKDTLYENYSQHTMSQGTVQMKTGYLEKMGSYTNRSIYQQTDVFPSNDRQSLISNNEVIQTMKTPPNERRSKTQI